MDAVRDGGNSGGNAVGTQTETTGSNLDEMTGAAGQRPAIIRSLCSLGRPNGGQRTGASAAEKEPQSVCGMKIAQEALQSVGVRIKNLPGTNTGNPEYAAAVSILFTRATNQDIMLGTDPRHVLSTSILYNSLLHDKRFSRVPVSSKAAPGDIIVASGGHQVGYAGIVVDHGRIVSMGRAGTVQNDSSLIEIQRSHPPTLIFRYFGVQRRPTYPLANAGYNPNEPRLPAGQPGGGQWTRGAGVTQNWRGPLQMAPSTPVLSGGSSVLSDGVGREGTAQKASGGAAKTSTPSQSGSGQSTSAGAGTKDRLEQALRQLDEGYAKEVADIKKMTGITDQERNAGLKSLKEKYQKARNDLINRISKIEQTAQDMAFAYGGKASDYYKYLDDTDPKVQELIRYLAYFDLRGFKGAFLLALRKHQGGAPPSPSDPQVLNAALLAAMGMLGEEGGAAEDSALGKATDIDGAEAGLGKNEPPQLARGKRAHAEEPVLPGEEKEVTTPSGKRMDRYNEEQAHIREIKPNNPRAIKQGQKQVEGYKAEKETETGRPHTTEVTPYNPNKYQTRK